MTPSEPGDPIASYGCETRASQLDREARVFLAKLEEPGTASLTLGAESEELVFWMVQRGWVEVETACGASLVVRAKRG